MLYLRLEAYVELAICVAVFLRDDLGTGRSHGVNVRYHVYGLYAVIGVAACRCMGSSIQFQVRDILRTDSRRSVALPLMHVDNAGSDIVLSFPLINKYCVKLIASSVPMDWS